jgi:heme-degrading monooxygenase HmoA
MYTSTFTFAKGQYDDEFYALDNAIAQVAKSIPGYLGEEAWENQETGLISNVYYWESLEALQVLINHPTHIKAKKQQSRWLKGYQVVIAQVLRSYGDGGIAHPLVGNTSVPNMRFNPDCLRQPVKSGIRQNPARAYSNPRD